MKCRKCKRKLRKSADFCPACGTKVKRHRLLKIIILFALLLIGVGLFAVKKYGFIDKIMKSEVDSDLNDVPKIKNIEEAISYAKKVGEEVGYKNAFSELTEKNTSSVDGDHYYRMQQKYNGIPVYGRDAIYVTDKENNVIIITGNAQDIEGDVQVSPSVTVAEVCNSIAEYAKNNLTTEEWEEVNIEELHEEDLCIYDFSEDGKSHLAYQIWENGYIFIIDANNAEILSANQTVCSVTGYAASDEKRENGFEIRKIENGYCLSNSGISDVYNWNGQSSNGFKNGEKDIVNATRVSSSDRVFGNESGETDYEEAVRFYLNVYKIEKWLEETCGFSEKTELYFNDGYSDGKNALGGLYTNHQVKKDIPLLSMGKITGVDDIDVIGHEYGHVLFWSTVGENIIDGDISEGISDIYGELAEEWYYDKNEPDWCIVGDKINVERNLKEPHTTGNAAYLSDVEIREEAREGYYYSTVISHAAYLMWNGIKGEEDAKISSSEIAKLWYRIVLTISTNCNYEEIREKAEWAAVCMQLTEKQKECISRAFDEVGIKEKTVEENSNKKYDKNIQPYSILKVLDKAGQLYSNYILNITGFTTRRELAYDPILMTDVYMAQKYNNSFEINEAKPFQLDIPNGYYTFTVTNATNTEDKYTFTVSISDAGTEERIELYTDFESTESRETDVNEKDAYEIYKTATEKSISSGNWREEVKLTGDMNLVSSDQREKVKTKATLEAVCNVENYDEKNLSKLKISGDGKIQAAGQNLAWTVDYSEGVAHYQYTEPTSYTNDVAIDPICFQFNVLTREMMQDASVSGDTISFTLSGDDMAQVTSEAMNMMNGIENLKFNNGIVKILIDKEAGIISGMNMTFHASMEYMGYQAEVDYDVEYQFIPNGSSKSSETEQVPEGENGIWYGQFDQSKVPEGAGEYNGHYYYAYNLDSVTDWEDAKQYCEQMGGYLATVTSRGEDEFLYSYLTNECHYENAYFGFNDREEEGNWKWSNGEESSYTNWHEGEPNAENSEEDFAMYYYKYPDGSWNDGDFDAGTLNGGTVFICEWGEYQIGSNAVEGSAEELYSSVLKEYHQAFSDNADYSYEELKEKYPYINQSLVSLYFEGSKPFYGFYDIDGNGVDEMFIGYETIMGYEYKIVDVLTYDTENGQIRNIGEGEVFSVNAGSFVYDNGVIYNIKADNVAKFYRISSDGYHLELIKSYTLVKNQDNRFYFNDAEMLDGEEFDKMLREQGNQVPSEWISLDEI